MSVGAGSIKRAAKAVNPTTEEVKAVETKEVKADVVAEKAEVKAKAPAKAANKKSTAKKTTAKAATSKTEKAVPAKSAAPKTAEKSNYEAYGVGQQLPIHLM